MANNNNNSIHSRPTLGPKYKSQRNHHRNSNQINRHNNNNHNNNNNTQNQNNNTNNQNPNSISNGQQQQITGAPLDAPADCTIACDEGHLTAHKLILCDHSKYLQDILSKFPTAEHPIIILTELNIMDIRILVNYMYTGELVITNESSPTSLLRAAQILKIDSLTDDEQQQQHQDGGGTGNQQQQQQAGLDDDGLDEDGQMLDDFELDRETERGQQQQQHHHNHHGANRGEQDDDNNREEEEEDEEDEEEEDAMDDDDDDDDEMDDHNNNISNNNNNIINNNNNNHNHINNHHTRLINSIRNIYNLQFMNEISSPTNQQTIPQHLSLGENTTNSSKSESFGSNSITSNHHLDLEDLQDSRPGLDNKNNKIRCHLCNIGLSDVKCLYRHVLTRHLPEKWGYKCEFCDREFSRDDHLMRHYTTKHKNMEFNREKIRETRRLNREMAKNFHDQISTA